MFYNIGWKIDETRNDFTRLNLDYEEAEKIENAAFSQEDEIIKKSERLKNLTKELNIAVLKHDVICIAKKSLKRAKIKGRKLNISLVNIANVL